MRPEYGDYNLYKAQTGMFSKRNPVAAEIHVVIPVLHGTNGEDGIFEGVLETIGIPYAGCNTLSSANGMDKITMKMILRESGIPVVDYVWFTDKQWLSQRDGIIGKIESQLGYPVIVKPANLGSSVGIGKASDRESLIAKVNEAERFSQRLIVEHMIEDLKEINCSVLGDADEHQSSVCEEPVKSGDFLSYDDKYVGGGMQSSEKRIPADLPEEMSEKIRHMAGETFRVLSCHGVSRVDVMVDKKDNAVYVNEINTIPGSLSYYLWGADSTINRWKEIETFLQGITDTETLAGLLEQLQKDIQAAYVKAIEAAVKVETDRAEAAEAGLQKNIDGEQQRAEAAETALGKRITDTKAVLQQTDTEIKQDIAAVRQTIFAIQAESAGRVIPLVLEVESLHRITYGNTVKRYIKTQLLPQYAVQNVLWLSDGKAVEVEPDGEIVVLGLGKSRVHVIPTENTALHKTVTVEVVRPSLIKANNSSLLMVGASILLT